MVQQTSIGSHNSVPMIFLGASKNDRLQRRPAALTIDRRGPGLQSSCPHATWLAYELHGSARPPVQCKSSLKPESILCCDLLWSGSLCFRSRQDDWCNLTIKKTFSSSYYSYSSVTIRWRQLLSIKNASNQKMSVNRPLLNIPTDSKTTFEIFKTQKSNSKMTP